MSLRERIAQGDRRALAEAFVECRPLVLRMLRERKRSRDDVQDLVQDAFLRLPESARKCSPGTSLAGCVASAVIIACRQWDRARATRGDDERRAHLDADELERFEDLALTPEETLDQRQRVHHLSELMEQLTPIQRSMLIGREMQGLSPGELAERFGAAVSNISHARRHLEQLAAASPLAEVFAAMPRRDGSHAGSSRSSRYLRRKQRQKSEHARAGATGEVVLTTPASTGTRGGLSPSGSFILEV